MTQVINEVKLTIHKIVDEVKRSDQRRKETIKRTNELAKQAGMRVDWGQYKVTETKGGKP